MGPILFLLYINDLKLSIQQSQFLLFADDCKIFRNIQSSNDFGALQHDLNSFVLWCGVNGLDLNIEKCKHVEFTRKTKPNNLNYYINGVAVETVLSVKDLGVYIDTKMSFNLHIDNIVTRANKLLGFVNRSTKLFSNTRCMIILYTSLVRSILEYCSVIWSPSYQVHIHRIEGVQKKFIRQLCFRGGIDYESVSYNYLLQHFSLPPLVQRRSFVDVMFVFKVLNVIIKCPTILDQFSFFIPSRPLRHIPFLALDFHRTNYGLHSSLSRLTRLVNSLNLNFQIFSTYGILAFKSFLRQQLYN